MTTFVIAKHRTSAINRLYDDVFPIEKYEAVRKILFSFEITAICIHSSSNERRFRLFFDVRASQVAPQVFAILQWQEKS